MLITPPFERRPHRPTRPGPRPALRSSRRARAAGLSGLAVLASLGTAAPAWASSPVQIAPQLPAGPSPTAPAFSYRVVPTVGPVLTGSLDILVPKPLSTIGDNTPEMEVAVELSGDPDRPIRFRADQLTTFAIAPVAVELTVDMGTTRATFGYAARSAAAPRLFALDVGTATPATDVTAVKLAAHTTGGAANLPVLVDVLRRNNPEITTDDLDIGGLVHDASAAVDLTVDLADGRVTYAGSAPLEALDLTAARPGGIGGTPATTAVVGLDGVPTDVTFDFGQITTGIGVQVGPGQQIGMVDVVLRDVAPTAAELIPSGTQGLFVTQKAATTTAPARFVVHGRLAGLREAEFTETSSTSRTDRKVEVATDPSIPEHAFTTRIDRGPGNVATGTIQGLPDDVTVVMTTDRSPTGGGALNTVVDWSASETAAGLVLDASATGFKSARVEAVPLQKDTEVCIGFTPGRCSNNYSLQSGQSVSVKSSVPTDLDLFACLVGSGTCTEASGTATEFVDIDELELIPVVAGQPAKLAVGIGGPRNLAEDLSIGVDTDNSIVNSHGDLRVKLNGDVKSVAVDLDHAQAQDRLVWLTEQRLWPFGTVGYAILAESGTMSCGPDTRIGLVRTLGIGQFKQELCS